MPIRITNQTRGTLLAEAADVADDSRKRRTGLLKRDRLESGEGLWIVPCEAVHSFGMRFTIDVLFLDRAKRVRKLRKSLNPSRISACLLAHSVLELPEGTIELSQTQRGDQLVFERP